MNPAYLWGLLAVLIVPLLHLARRRPKRVLTPHVFLWERVLKSGQKSRSIRLKHWLLMLLQMMIIANVVLLFAEPTFTSETRVPRSTLLLVDLSPSMAAQNRDGSTRLNEAIREATHRIDALFADGPVALGVLGDHPSVRLPFGSTKDEFVDVLQSLQPEWTRTDAASINAISRAAEADRTWLFTDRTFDGELTPGIEVIPLGDRHDNVAIVGARLSESEGGDAVDVHVNLVAAGFARAVSVVARQGGVVVGNGSVDLMSGEQELTFTASAARGGFVHVAIEPETGDALSTDDAVEIYWPDDPPVRVLVVSDDVAQEFLDGIAALSAVCRVDAADHVKPERWRSVVSGYDLVILDGLDEQAPLPPASYLLINSFAPGLSVKAIEEFEDVAFVRRRENLEILRGVALQDLSARRATRVEISGDVKCVVEGSIGPLISARLTSASPFVHLSFDVRVANASLALMEAWPLLLRDVLEVMHPKRRRLYAGLAPIGGHLVPTRISPMPTGEETAKGRLIGHSSSDVWPLVDVHLGSVFQLPLVDAGQYTVEVDGRSEKVGLAPLSTELTNIAPRRTDRAAVLGEPEMKTEQRDHREFLCALALFFLMCEWFCYQRRWGQA